MGTVFFYLCGKIFPKKLSRKTKAALEDIAVAKNSELLKDDNKKHHIIK